MKKNINILMIFMFIFLGFIIHVDAADIKDLSSGDIVIGNTKFKSGTWISASRAAKAGSLYTNNTGRMDANTYLYINPYVIYIYDDSIENYKLLTTEEIAELEKEMNIYYENNESLLNTYESYVEYEYDEEFDETYIYDANEVFRFYDMYGEIFLEDETDKNIILDYENKTITCPYHYVFDFQVVANNEGEKYKGICGIDDFKFINEDVYNLEEISIESIELTSSNNNSNLLNQDKIVFNSDNYVIEVLEELEDITYEYGNEYYTNVIEGKYVALDIHFSENNDITMYSFTDRFGVSYDKYYIENIDRNSIRLFVEIDDYGYQSLPLIILDNAFSKFEDLYFNIIGLTKPSYDLTLENIEIVDSSMISNNSLIHSMVDGSELIDAHEYNYLDINIIGQLSMLEFNQLSNEWIAIDLILNEDVKEEYLDVILNNNGYNYYEVIENKIRLYLVEDTYVSISDVVTSSTDNYMGFFIRINKYDEDSYVNYRGDFKGSYGIEELYITKIPINYGSYSDLYYDEENSKLYYKDTYDNLFMGTDSLKMITTEYDSDYNEIAVLRNVELYIRECKENHECSYSTPALIEDYDSLYNYVVELLNKEEVTNIEIYTFFKPDKVFTEEEIAEIDKFDALVETGKVKIIDISSSVYE